MLSHSFAKSKELRGKKDEPLKTEKLRGYSSAGRAPALQAGGHRFDPDYLHQGRKDTNQDITSNMGL